jgi:hypothetical protein
LISVVGKAVSVVLQARAGPLDFTRVIRQRGIPAPLKMTDLKRGEISRSAPQTGIPTNKKGTVEAVPSLRSNLQRTYDFFSTSRLFCTLKTPNTWLARMPATCLSVGLATVP